MKIALFGKNIYDNDRFFVAQLIDNLREKGVELSVYAGYADIAPDLFSAIDKFYDHDSLKQFAPQIMLSIGGDGTMLDALPLLLDSGIPVLGINTGRLGFLSSVAKDNVESAINNIIRGEYDIEKRTVLQLVSPDNVFRNNQFALNELSVLRRPELSLLSIKVFVDDVYLNTYWGDGILVATPTGSTAYSLSAGGPIITPNSNSIVITPMAAHTLTVRPVVMPDDSTIKIIVEGRGNQCVISMDSQTRPIDTPTQLLLKKARFSINTVKIKDNDFFATIRNKLMWGKDNRN